ncbi:hypothetical protein Misp01_07060 [Microtetraspora sp. NBRC 13810]|uniref:hypothetical protein n=1 Tax=Microtetraspora sp. NBRC 13810 TaxID=3030990 RepID=UPI0024A2D0F6|nr:hypothetical protein [Microtetraspora sp. NBRC 13810]GLW05576.1 hypothetical protein Misp01_07060 [Microtetraspora sp. NBRC 13810]
MKKLAATGAILAALGISLAATPAYAQPWPVGNGGNDVDQSVHILDHVQLCDALNDVSVVELLELQGVLGSSNKARNFACFNDTFNDSLSG